MNTDDITLIGIDAEAAEIFAQKLQGEWVEADQAKLEARLGNDPAYADAYRRAEDAWGALDRHAETPELMRYREEAMAYARHSNARRWLKPHALARHPWRIAAALAGIAFALGIAWQFSPFAYTPGQYHTGIGEQRTIELADHSHIALDAGTRLSVHFSKDARVVELQQGQAQFSVAHDPARPFKVQAGDRTIIAVGTVFTVEYVDQQVHVAMMEGRVAVVATPDPPRMNLRPTEKRTQSQVDTIELSAGEELRVTRDGHSTVTPQADLEAATAWREGKVIFRTEQLGDAVRRINRYSSLQIEIADESLATRSISGVFEAGDSAGFVDAVQRYLPVTADSSEANKIILRLK